MFTDQSTPRAYRPGRAAGAVPWKGPFMRFTSTLRVATALALFAGFGGLATGPASAQTPPPAAAQAGDPLLARVNGQEVRQSEVMATLRQMPAQVQQMPMDFVVPALVDQLISVKLLAAAGYAQNLQNDEEVKTRVKRAEERAVQELYLNRRIEQAISPDRLQGKYDAWVKENPPQDEVRASHILVADEATAKRLLDEINKGGDFADLARKNSTDQGSGPLGGDLGYFGAADMVAPFAEAAFTITPGNVGASPVQTQFGWHIIKVADKRQGAVPPLAEVEGQLRGEMQQEVVAALLEELRTGAKIEKFNADGTLAAP
jgi:peptidyl-prolyl cis-trans isomerase C